MATRIKSALQPFGQIDGAIESIVVDLQLDAERLRVGYAITGDLRRLRVPAPRPPRWTDKLWEHTCLEAFIGAVDRAAYYEFNFAPSSEWAAFAFKKYRDGNALEGETSAPWIETRRGAGDLTLLAEISLAELSLIRGAARWRIGLSAVIELSDGSKSYWALHHPADQPDFHHPQSFALALALPGASA